MGLAFVVGCCHDKYISTSTIYDPEVFLHSFRVGHASSFIQGWAWAPSGQNIICPVCSVEWKSTNFQVGIPMDIHRYSAITWISNDLRGYPRILTWSKAFRGRPRGRPRRRLRAAPQGPTLVAAMGHVPWAIPWAVHEYSRTIEGWETKNG